MADEKVEIEIVLDGRKAKKGFKKVEKQSKKTGDKVGRNLAAGFAKAGAAAGLLATAVGAIFVKKGIDAARQQEEAVNRLNTSLKLSGKFSREASIDFQNFASELQRNTTIGDELTLETAALIQSLGQLETDALKTATLAAADLSAALGIDLKAAALLVGKAAAGEVSSFSRYGLIIKKGATEAETFTRALDGINSKFGGAAAAAVVTFSGRISQLSNEFGDFLEGIGDLIIKLPVFAGIIQKIAGFFTAAGDGLKAFTKNADRIAELNNKVIDFGLLLVEFGIVPIEGIKKAFNAMFVSLQAGFEVIIAAVADTILVVIEEINSLPLVNLDVDTTGLEGIVMAAEDTAIRANEAIARIGSVEGTDLAVTAAQGLESFRTTAEEVQATMDGLSFKKTQEEAKKVAFEFKITAKEIATGISQGVQQAVKNAKSGGNALEGFFGGFLAFIGNWAIQTGTTLIAVGLGIEALKASVVGLVGGPAIAAGIALVALGTLLSTLSSGGSTAEAAGGGVASDVGQSSGEVAVEAEEAPEKETKVAINVEGTVLDPQSVGNQIAQILNDTFEAGGTRVVTT